MPKKRASFFENPNTAASREATAKIITGAKNAANEHGNYHGNDNYHGNNRRGRRPTGRELMTRRVVVLFTPSKYNRLLDIAEAKGISFNELVNSALDTISHDSGSGEEAVN
jgi:hypothetical protein